MTLKIMDTDNQISIDSERTSICTTEESFDMSVISNKKNDKSMSKRQLKKLKKLEKWLERKPEKRLREKMKMKEKRAHAKANNIELGPSRKLLKMCTMANSPCKMHVTIDLSFNEFMSDKDIAKMIKQILRCYALNRRAATPLQFSLTNFTGKSLLEMEKHNGYQHWDVKFYSENFLNIYGRERIVYLTSESENVIETLDENAVYVIGGLVDHNAQKGLCHRLAKSNNIKHARLPLDKYLEMKTRRVLSIVHVFEILLKIAEGRNWQEVLLEILPERKNAQPLTYDIKSDSSGDDKLNENSKIEDKLKNSEIEDELKENSEIEYKKIKKDDTDT